MPICRSCSNDYSLDSPGARELTCSDSCHRRLVVDLIEEFGPTKLVTSLRTGKTHLVPTIAIIEDGIREQDLEKYPVVAPDRNGGKA